MSIILSEAFFWNLFYLFLFASLPIFLILEFSNIRAPYGRFTSSIWGNKMISAKWGWIFMESPASLIFVAYFLMFAFQNRLTLMQVVFFFVWQFHYAFRSFIYPVIARLSKPMPLGMMFSALVFQLFNTFFQVRWVFDLAPSSLYSASYVYSPQFITGVLIFLTGTVINRQSDAILRRLRQPGETQYKIPYGGFYKWVSCPNYLGEIITWLGWAVMLWHWVGLAFFLWTVANLAPRAFSTHKWYLEKFSDYPKERKALLPFLI